MFFAVLTSLFIGHAEAACTVTLTQPAANTTQYAAPTFRWNAAGTCSQYRVQLSNTAAFTTATSLPYVTVRNQKMDETTFDTLATTAGAAKYWRVQSIDTTSVTANTVGRRIILRQGDVDGDTYIDVAYSGGTDCDDTNAAINPGATEICNLIDDDCDASIDEDQGACYDTGLQVVWYAGEATVSANRKRFTAGRFGYDITTWKSLPGLDSVCEAMGTWAATGPALTTCTFCDWAFNLTVSGTVATGPYCDDYGLTDGVWDGFAAGWGFQDAYSYAYAGNTYDYSDIVMYYYAPYATWYVFSYNYSATVGGVTYGPYGYNTGDVLSMTFHQPYGVFYYYYP